MKVRTFPLGSLSGSIVQMNWKSYPPILRTLLLDIWFIILSGIKELDFLETKFTDLWVGG
jgi:hypothetical protein